MKVLSQIALGALLLVPFSKAHSFPHSGVVQLSAGGYHTCALLADHRIACWGGSGSVAPSSAPTMISGIDNAVSVTGGTDFACALTTDQDVYCWATTRTANSETERKYRDPPLLRPSTMGTLGTLPFPPAMSICAR